MDRIDRVFKGAAFLDKVVHTGLPGSIITSHMNKRLKPQLVRLVLAQLTEF